MDVSVRELRNHTAPRDRGRSRAASPSSSRVHGRPVADIVPRRTRSERRPSEVFLADIASISALAGELGVASDAGDFDTGLTTDDMA